MMEHILIAFVCIFAVIGFITVVYSVLDALPKSSGAHSEAELVMFVKNRENDIEGVARSLERTVSATTCSIKPTSIIMVDCGSTDDTKQILTHLTDDIGLLKYCTKEEYLDYVKNALQ